MQCVFAVLNDPPCIVTKDGRVFSRRYSGHPLTERKPTIDKNGYKQITIKHKNQKVHRLAARAWFGKCPVDKEVDHIDRNKLNNDIDNLRYVSKSDNCLNRSSSDRAVLHWGSPGSEQWKIANREYKRLKRSKQTEEERHERSKRVHEGNKQRLAEKGLYRTVRIIDGKRKNVVLPIEDKYIRGRNEHGQFTFSKPS